MLVNSNSFDMASSDSLIYFGIDKAYWDEIPCLQDAFAMAHQECLLTKNRLIQCSAGSWKVALEDFATALVCHFIS